MNEHTELVTSDQSQAELANTPEPNNKPPDAKQLRVEHVGKLLEKAYAGASTLKLKKEEWEQLRAEFPDEAIEVRNESGRSMYYIEHMELRERVNSVFHPGEVSEIVRSHRVRSDTNEVLVDLVLVVRGHFVAEAVATVRYFPNSPKANFGDSIESAQSEAYRRCCKHWGIGCQTWRSSWRKGYEERQKANQSTAPGKTGRDYTLKEPSEFQKVKARATAEPEVDEDGVPF
jgi:hypothetical protein